jgi:transglutaminase-like putative cysteine protease
MTVLARSAGLPARYCTGYAMLRASENSDSSFIASNKTAHAWTDIYFEGIGWVTFDPSDWDFSELIESERPSGEAGPPVSPAIPITDR